MMKLYTKYCLVLLALAALYACNDDDPNIPLQENSVSTGTSHNAGQNCLRCHDKPNRGTPVYITAGTVYDRANPQNPYPGTIVNLYSDSEGTNLIQSIEVDQSGNFFSSSTVDYTGPVYAEVVSDVGSVMKINPAPHGDCNKCHDHGNEPRIYGLD